MAHLVQGLTAQDHHSLAAHAPFTNNQRSEAKVKAAQTKIIPSCLDGRLPCQSEAQPGYIPINKDGQRLDCHLPFPPRSAWDALMILSRHVKLCRWFHLVGNCGKGNNCLYDHSEVTDDMRNCLRYGLRRLACHQGGLCRRIDC